MTNANETVPPIQTMKVAFKERVFHLIVIGSALTILDDHFLDEFNIEKERIGQEPTSHPYRTQVNVPMYDDRYPTFNDWLTARSSHLQIIIQPSPYDDRHIISIYDNGPEIEHRDEYNEVAYEDGGNFGYSVALAMPEFAEWSIINAPLHGESFESWAVRGMEGWNESVDMLGPDGVFIDTAAEDGVKVTEARDLQKFSDDELAKMRAKRDAIDAEIDAEGSAAV